LHPQPTPDTPTLSLHDALPILATRAAMKSPKRAPARELLPAPERFNVADAVFVAALLALALLLMARTGSQRGVELMPWPDGLEYAATAVNMDRGLGPVLHFGGYSYPSRYSQGYPLILAIAWPLVGHDPAKLHFATILTGLLAIAITYLLCLRLFGRVSAALSTLVVALSPIILTYSTLVLS